MSQGSAGNVIAAVCSFFVPGLGQLVQGRLLMAIFQFCLAAVLWFFSRGVVDLRVRNWAGTLGVGVGVFAIWIGPDLLWPHYRESILFQNALTGKIASSVPEELRASWIVLVFRTMRAALIVPIVEELFWRAWLMRSGSPDVGAIDEATATTNGSG